MSKRHHPTLSPSSLYHVGQCALYRGKDGPAGKAAERGTLLHTAIEEVIQEKQLTVKPKPADMEEVAWAKSEILRIFGRAPSIIEQEFSLLAPDFSEVTFGTVDYADENPAHSDAPIILDVKTGMRNFGLTSARVQLAAYALMFMQRTGSPFCEVIALWTKTKELDRWTLDVKTATDIVMPIIKRAGDPSKMKAGDYCKWCRFELSCPKRAGSESAPKESVQSFDPESFMALTPSERAKMYRGLKVAQEWVAGAIAEITRRAIAGEVVLEGFEVRTRSGARKWKSPEDAIEALIALANERGIDPSTVFKMSPLGIGEATKVFGAGGSLKTLIDTHTEAGAESKMLVDLSEKGEKADGNKN